MRRKEWKDGKEMDELIEYLEEILQACDDSGSDDGVRIAIVGRQLVNIIGKLQEDIQGQIQDIWDSQEQS